MLTLSRDSPCLLLAVCFVPLFAPSPLSFNLRIPDNMWQYVLTAISPPGLPRRRPK